MSNKTPSVSRAKTASARSKITTKRIWLVFMSVVVLLGIAFVALSQQGTYLELGGTRFNAEVMDTDESRKQGLSGRDGLAQDAAMLFVFETSKTQCIWMKDMRFDIDILWFDSAQRLVSQKRRVSPQTYPKSFCVDNAQYVVELAAGTAQALGLEQGDTFVLQRR
jgi:uncharacterized membrane protein (UPF0127 family)